MNILLITPDAVGGTLLQQVLTIQMQLHNFNKPLVAGHLELGLERIFSDVYNQEILTTRKNCDFSQSPIDIKNLLIGADQQYNIGKISHYNILRRQDDPKELLQLYNYFNENYFIISCRRKNLFEHALSWSLNKVTGRLNVFDPEEKITSFFYYYKEGLTLDTKSLLHSLNSYKQYLNWADTHFDIGSYYVYEDHMNNLESYVLSLPVFSSQPKKITWEETFGISFTDWNKSHYYKSDLGNLMLTHNQFSNSLPKLSFEEKTTGLHNIEGLFTLFNQQYKKVAGENWPKLSSFDDYNDLPSYIKKECEEKFGLDYFTNIRASMNEPKYELVSSTNIISEFCESLHLSFLAEKKESIDKADSAIKKMQEIGVFNKGIPIKKQTLQEKQALIKNFSECLEVYNEWAVKNTDIADTVSESEINSRKEQEQEYWKDTTYNLLLK